MMKPDIRSEFIRYVMTKDKRHATYEPEKCAVVSVLFWMFAAAAGVFILWLVLGGLK